MVVFVLVVGRAPATAEATSHLTSRRSRRWLAAGGQVRRNMREVRKCGISLPAVVGHEWALVDVETSGLRAVRDRILSPVVITVGRDGRTNEEFSTLLGPGCDPGPVHIHGLTADRLKGAPRFENVADLVAEMLEGGCSSGMMHRSTTASSSRSSCANVRLPVEQRLCTLT